MVDHIRKGRGARFGALLGVSLIALVAAACGSSAPSGGSGSSGASPSSVNVAGLLRVLSSRWLLDQLASLPGYDPARCGEHVASL